MPPFGQKCCGRSTTRDAAILSLFLRSDGLLIGYYETEDDAAAQAALDADPRTAAWEAKMSEFFISLDGRP